MRFAREGSAVLVKPFEYRYVIGGRQGPAISTLKAK
jgi:hypothetical protein